MGFLAHSENAAGQTQLLRDHLTSVAELTGQFASPWGAAEEGRLAGLLHDLGKYGELFQLLLENKEQKIDHWSAGAWEALTRYRQDGIASALAIQGHHVGLQRAEPDALSALNPNRLGAAHPLGLRLSAPEHLSLVEHLAGDGISPPAPPASSAYSGLYAPSAAAMLDVRMLFSCLVDADFLDTEAHYYGGGYRPQGPSLEAARDLTTLREYLKDLAERSQAAAHVNELRADLLQACLSAGEWPQGLFTLTAPTGAGKTLSMLAFALAHAVAHRLQRVVMVIPYLSIIDQTVGEYRKVLQGLMGADELDRYVLEDHSLAGTRDAQHDRGDSDEQVNHRRLLAENWDAPIVVTTSVQFLESLFANRSRPCRKLHRLAGSVILFDEVQTLGTNLAVPTLATLSHLAERYGASVVFSTATQPAFTYLDEAARKYCTAGWQPREIVPGELRLFERARRTTVRWPRRDDGPVSWSCLAEEIVPQPQALCITNIKRHAAALLGLLQDRVPEGALFHLSTSMCPAHRAVKLAEVRARLDDGRPCVLVSTQCVEAGVDVDFPVVYRAWGPLDAIAQAAGRCNRNGRQPTGTVRVFIPDGGGKGLYPDDASAQAAAVAEMVLQMRGEDGMDINSPDLFESYYRELYGIKGVADAEGQKTPLLDAVYTQNFAETARLYRVIKTDAINVLVPYCPGTFEALAEEVRQRGLTAAWVRKARAHSVGVYRPREGDALMGWLEPVPIAGRSRFENADDWFIYLGGDGYDDVMGLVLPDRSSCAIA